MEGLNFKNHSYAVVIFSSFFLFGCGMPDDTISRTKTTTRKVVRQEASDYRGEHLTGSAKIESHSDDEGSWAMESTADDYHYKDKTVFKKGAKTWAIQSEGIAE